MATITAATTGGNFTTGSTWVGGVAPTAADDAVIGVSTVATVTIDSGSVCRSLDCNGFTNTLSHTAGVTLTIGDATAGLGNRALRLASGMTYTLGSASTSKILFVSTSATQQTLAWAGKTAAYIEFNPASNGSWIFSDAVNEGSGGSFFVLKGTIDLNGTANTFGDVNLGGSTQAVTLGSGTTTCQTWNAQSTGLTLTTTGSTIVKVGAGGSFFGGGFTYNIVTHSPTAAGQNFLYGANTFSQLTFTGTAAKTNEFILGANQIVTGTFTCTGNSAINRVLLRSDTLGTARTITNSGATMTWSNVDLRDIALGTAFDASAITGKSGDCGGNSNITFTTAATQVWFGTSGGNWSTNSWSGRVPLPQDDVTINQAFSASQTITLDMPRAGKSINWTGATGSPVWAKSTATTIYGSLTMIAGMTNSGTTSFTFEGRGAFTLTSSGQTFTNPVTIQMVGGTLTQQDALLCSSTGTHTHGTYSLNDFNATYTTFSTSASTTRTLTRGSGTMTCTGTGTVFNATATTGLTMTATTGTLAVTDVSSTAKTIVTGGLSLGVASITTGGSGTVTFTGAGTFTRLLCPGGSTKSIILPGSTTTSFNGTNPFPSGAAGNLLTFTSSSGTATVAFTSQAVCDHISLTDVAASTGPQIAGANSTLSGVTTNWQLSPASTGNMLLCI